MDVAAALEVTPGSSRFRMIAGAALAYGLTTGGAYAPEIGISPLGMRIVRPMTDGEDIAAKREALLKPRIVGDFLRKYDGASLPSDNIAKNVLQDLGVPAERLASVLEFILDSAAAVGFVRDIGSKRFVDLAGTAPTASTEDTNLSPEVLPTQTLVPQRQTLPVPVSPSSDAVAVAVSPAVYVNIEIHIAADSSSDTIEDIFRNMRRYVLNGSGPADNDAADSD